MDEADFERSLVASAPPSRLSRALEGLWWARKGDWQRAHEVVQAAEDDPACAWVHAALHREEGDLENAEYWYRCAGKLVARTSYAEELHAIGCELFGEPRR
jgi:hypothetical protein